MNAKQYSKAFRQLAKMPIVGSSHVVREINAEIQQNFSRGLDAYRVPFKPLKKSTIKRRRFKGKPILSQTEEGRDSVKVSAISGSGIRATFGTSYMQFHITGTRYMPVRAFLPKSKIPDAWLEIMLQNYERIVGEVLNA